jgi:hypothetical protein
MLPKLQRTNLSAVDPHGSSTTSLVLWDTSRSAQAASALNQGGYGEQYELRRLPWERSAVCGDPLQDTATSGRSSEWRIAEGEHPSIRSRCPVAGSGGISGDRHHRLV